MGQPVGCENAVPEHERGSLHARGESGTHHPTGQPTIFCQSLYTYAERLQRPNTIEISAALNALAQESYLTSIYPIVYIMVNVS
jgi:hypothetical protein